MSTGKTKDRLIVTWELPMWLFIAINSLSALGFLAALILIAEMIGQFINH